MTVIEFKKFLSKANTQAIVISIVLIALGLVMIVHTLLNKEHPVPLTIGLSFGGMILVLGLIAFKRMLSDQLKARMNTHEILEAIKRGDRSYLIWVYIEKINTTLEHGGPSIGPGHQNISYFTKDCKGKGKPLMTGKKYSANEIIEFLSTQFDIPYIGYSAEKQTAVNDYFNGKVKGHEVRG